MEEEIVLPSEEPEHKCENCGVGISPMQADTSRHITWELGGSDGIALCRQCLDREERPSRAAINGRTEVSL